MAIGQELLNVPLPEMIFKMANAIAQGQRRLDKTSLDTALALSKAKVSVIPDIFEIVETQKLSEAAEDTLPDTAGDTPTIKVSSIAGKPVKMTLLQAGILPTFYQFTESLIEVKISISHHSSRTSEFEAGADFEVKTEAEAHGGLFGFGASGSVSTTFASHVNYKSASTYDYTAEGSSLLRTTLKPVPPPARIVPRIVTVDATALTATPPGPVKVTFGA